MKKFFTLLATVLIAVNVNANPIKSSESSIATTAEEESQLLGTYTATPVEGYESTTGVTTVFEEWSDKCVIKAFDGTADNDIVLTWDDNGWNGINGRTTNFVYFHNEDAKYVAALLYSSSYIGGSWNSTDGGTLYIGGYFYESYEDTGTFKYMYWTLTPNKETGIATINDNTDKVSLVKRLTKRGIVIEKNGKQYSADGRWN